MKSEFVRVMEGEKRHTDPYGDLEFVIGSGDDFVCFDWEIRGHTLRIESVLNSETGHFIDRFNEPIEIDLPDKDIDLPGVSFTDLQETILDEIYSALDWCYENEVRPSKVGWNQDPYYLYRSIMLSLHADGFIELPALRGRKRRWSRKEIRLGGKQINQFVQLNII